MKIKCTERRYLIPYSEIWINMHNKSCLVKRNNWESNLRVETKCLLPACTCFSLNKSWTILVFNILVFFGEIWWKSLKTNFFCYKDSRFMFLRIPLITGWIIVCEGNPIDFLVELAYYCDICLYCILMQIALYSNAFDSISN